MRHNRLLGLLICALLPLLAFAQQRKPRPITFDTDTPFVHDPVMAYEKGVYYAFYTGWNIGCMTSTDRRTWSVKRDGLLKSIPAWTHDSVPGFERHVWAPDVIRWRNRWWMAYSCSTFGRTPRPLDCSRPRHWPRPIGKTRDALWPVRGGATTGTPSTRHSS